MGLGVGVGIGRKRDFARRVVRNEVALSRSGDAVGEVEAGIEPLRTIGGRHLIQEHVRDFGLEGIRIDGGGEVAVGLAPMTPASTQSRDDLPNGTLRTEHRVALFVGDRRPVRGELRHAGFPEIFTDHDVGCELTPGCRDFCIVHFEDHRAIGIRDAACSGGPLDRVVYISVLAGETSGNLH